MLAEGPSRSLYDHYMIPGTHHNPIMVDELLSGEQFGVDDAALMLLINSFSLLLRQSAA